MFRRMWMPKWRNLWFINRNMRLFIWFHWRLLWSALRRWLLGIQLSAAMRLRWIYLQQEERNCKQNWSKFSSYLFHLYFSVYSIVHAKSLRPKGKLKKSNFQQIHANELIFNSFIIKQGFWFREKFWKTDFAYYFESNLVI